MVSLKKIRKTLDPWCALLVVALMSERERWYAAAERAGMTPIAWARDVLNRAAA